MVWWTGIVEYRQRAAIIAGVAIAHLVCLAAILSHVIEINDPPPRNILEIELAELTPQPAPAPELPAAPPEPISEPPPAPADPIEARPVADPLPTDLDSTPEPPVEAALSPDAPSVLTQLDQSEAGVTETQDNTGSPATGGGETVTPAQIANILRQSECLKLKQQYDETCPKADPFLAATGVAERAIPPERLFEDPRYVAKTVGDIVHQQEWAKRFGTQDADLFTDPESPGAYNARRIRNGQEPIWSEEMRAGFRKKD